MRALARGITALGAALVVVAALAPHALATAISSGGGAATALLARVNTWTAAQTFAPTSSNTSGLSATGNGVAAGGVFTGGAGSGPAVILQQGNTVRGLLAFPTIAADPSGAVDGDMWVTTTAAKVQLGGVAVQLGGAAAWPSRRTATDASDYIVWTLDETAYPLANTGSAGSNGNVTVLNTGASSVTLGMLGLAGGGYGAMTTGKNGSSAGSSTTLEPAYPLSISGWVYSYTTTGGEIAGKKFQPNGTYTGALLSIDVGITGAATYAPNCEVATATVRHSCQGTGNSMIATNVWHHIGCTYDGTNIRTYHNGNLENTCAFSGAIDYGTHGPWYVGANQDNSGGIEGIIDDVRVATVARPLSYFQGVWQAGTGLGR